MQFTIVWLLNEFTLGLGGIICIVVGAIITYLDIQGQKKAAVQTPIQVDPRWQEDKKN